MWVKETNNSIKLARQPCWEHKCQCSRKRIRVDRTNKEKKKSNKINETINNKLWCVYGVRVCVRYACARPNIIHFFFFPFISSSRCVCIRICFVTRFKWSYHCGFITVMTGFQVSSWWCSIWLSIEIPMILLSNYQRCEIMEFLLFR